MPLADGEVIAASHSCLPRGRMSPARAGVGFDDERSREVRVTVAPRLLTTGRRLSPKSLLGRREKSAWGGLSHATRERARR